METAIKLNNVTKEYFRGNTGLINSISSLFRKKNNADSSAESFNALRDVSIEVKKGTSAKHEDYYYEKRDDDIFFHNYHIYTIIYFKFAPIH